MKYIKNYFFIFLLLLICMDCNVYAASLSVPQIRSAESVSSSSIMLSWDKVKGAEGYMVYCRESSQGSFKKVAKVVSKTTVTVKKLTCGKKYDFRIRAYKTYSQKTLYSKYSKTVVGYAKPSAPKEISAFVDDSGKITLSWTTVPEADGYYIYRRTPLDAKYEITGTVRGNITTYQDNSITGNETYYYKIVAYKTVLKKNIKGNASKASSVTTPKIYTVSPDSIPYNNRFTKYSGYTKETQSYYLLRSYLEMFADTGGGQLILEKGVYNLISPLQVPSNVTIRFLDGVVIRNIRTDNGMGLFIMADYRDMSEGRKYSGYNGVHDVSLIGEGNVIFDKQYKPNAGIMAVHTKNVLIDGITFKNMRSLTSHFIELDASCNAEIRNCIFTGYEQGAPKEAINLDVPDPATGGISWKGSSMDKTSNNGIYIHNNTFEDLPAAVGSHMFTKDHPHKNIRIENNRIINCHDYGIRAQNWEGVSINNNMFSKIQSKTTPGSAVTIEARGVKDFQVSGNIISDCDSFLKINIRKYPDTTIATHPGLADYGIIYNEVSRENVIYNMVSGLCTPYDISYCNTESKRDTQYWNTAK